MSSSCHDFEYIFNKFLVHLKSSYNISEISKNFSPVKSNSDLVKYARELIHKWEELDTILQDLFSDGKLKNDKTANEFRAKGNSFYSKKVLDKALLNYNLSIIYATTDAKSDSLALGHANKSAVLFELGLYRETCREITKSTDLGYPNKVSKLALRFIKSQIQMCLKESPLKDCDEQLLCLKLDEFCISTGKSLGYSFTVVEKAELLNYAKEALDSISTESESLPSSTDDVEVFPKEYLKSVTKGLCQDIVVKTPEIDSHHPDIEGLNNVVRIQFHEDQGRYLVADQDIYPGTVLAVDKGFSKAVLSPDHSKDLCSNCLRACIVDVIPCHQCLTVVFCSVECRDSALSSYHQYECSLLPLLHTLNMGPNTLLSVRMITTHPLHSLKSTIESYEQQQEREKQECSSLGFTEGKYNQNDYSPIYHLVENKDTRTVADLFKRSIMATLLTKLLKDFSPYFVKSDDDDGKNGNVTDEELLVAKTILRHLMNMPCNAHTISSTRYSSQREMGERDEVGSAAYGLLSLANHSCAPNVFRMNHLQDNVLRSSTFISKGEQISDCYSGHFALETKNDRKNTLSKQYHFDCNCEACQHDWHLYVCECKECSVKVDKLPLRCCNCEKGVLDDDICPSCHKGYDGNLSIYPDTLINHINSILYPKSQISHLNASLTSKNVRQELQRLSDVIETSKSEMGIGKMSRNVMVDVFKATYAFLKYVAKADVKTLLAAQEMLKYYFEAVGCRVLTN